MIDDLMPAWAKAMKERAEAREHLLLTEIATLRAEMKAGFEWVYEDTIVSVDVAVQAYSVTDQAREDVSASRKELVRLLRRLNALEQRIAFGRMPPTPEEAA